MPFRFLISVKFVFFSSFLQVVSACFGDSLEANYREAISHFKECYMALGIRVTPKVHAVFFHVADFCESKNRGLGPWSEQSTESVHHDFSSLWEDFKVRSFNHPNFKFKFLAGVCAYNGRHL